MRLHVTRALLLVVTVAVVSAPLATAAAAGASGPGSVSPRTTQATPPDPQEDVLGWENGYWYNESIDVNMTDGLNRSELDVVIARTMARIERIRQLEFERTPPVHFLSRAEYASAVNEAILASNITENDRLHQNTKFEALFLVGEETQVYDVIRRNQGGFAAAFYTAEGFPEANVSAGEIGIVRGSGGEIRLTETTLGHELVHALQDQHFDLATIPRGDTEDEARAIDGVIEGDASYVQSRYSNRCGGDWSGTCLTAERGGSSNFANVGLVLYQLVQYGNGLTFIEHVKARGGWEAVNALYTDLPRTTEQIVHPERYPNETARNLTIEDRSDETWRPLDLNGSVDHATFGEAGLYVMLWYPSYVQREDVIIGLNDPFLNRDVQPYDFAQQYSAGWDGDRLLPFVTNDSARTNQTGYVWKIAWDSTADAEEFLRAYRDLLEFYGAEQAGQNTYRIPERDFGSDYADAIHVDREGDLVTIVNAPSVEELSAVDADVEVVTETPTPTESPSDTRTRTRTPGSSPESTDQTTSPGGQPGLGAVAAVLALVLAVALRRRRA